jgi:hypothetical protein
MQRAKRKRCLATTSVTNNSLNRTYPSRIRVSHDPDSDQTVLISLHSSLNTVITIEDFERRDGSGTAGRTVSYIYWSRR